MRLNYMVDRVRQLANKYALENRYNNFGPYLAAPYMDIIFSSF